VNILKEQRNAARLEQRHLPFINTLEDRNIATYIGYHDIVLGDPLTLKHLFGLEIASMATVQRRLARLVSMGVVVKRGDPHDKRVFTLHLSASALRDYRRFAGALSDKNNGRCK
jgi:DNA-binding MarR family transcriptional regulator